jgi:hypothetical protein
MLFKVSYTKKINSLFVLFLVFATAAAVCASPGTAAHAHEISIPIKTGLITNHPAAPKVPVSCLVEAEMP